MANFNFSLGFNVEKEGLNRAKQELGKLKQEMQSNPMKFNLDQNSLKTAMQQVSVFEGALGKAFNQNMGKLDTREFVQQLHAAGYSLRGIREGFTSMGVDANRSIDSIERGLQSTNLSLKKTNALIDSMGTTLVNSFKWNVASQAINGIQSSVSRAIGFIKELDTSLNNIQIVSGKSADEMKVFAQSANEAAQALGKTTTEYTDASLIFFQQGKSAAEVRKLTEATLIGANITGQDTAETAELLTAALNGYNLAADKAMVITDKFSAVGAGTGSDFSELAIGFSKVASMASIAGVSVDQLNGMLATTATVTREAPESIGTSFKTIFGRMTEMKAGKADEDGWQLGQVNGALSKAGFSMLDETTGKLKDTGVLIEEVGSKWKDLNKETQLALSTAMAGSRQQNRLIALYENWDMYKDAVKMSQEAEGTAYEQNLVKMNTLEIKSKQLRAALEEMWMKMINSDAMKGMIDFLTKIVTKSNDFIDALHGMGPLLIVIAAAFARLMSGKISNGLVGAATNMKSYLAARARNSELTNASTSGQTDVVEMKRIERLQAQYKIRKYLTQEEQKEYIALQKTLEAEEKKTRLMEKNISLAKEYLKSSQFNGNINKMSAKATTNNTLASQNGNAANKLSQFDGANITTAKNMDLKNTLIAIRKLDAEYESMTKKRLLELKKEGQGISEIIGKLNEKKRLAEQESAEIKERLRYLSEEYQLELAQQRTAEAEVADTSGIQMDEMSARADSAGKVQNVINGATAATVAITGFVSASKAYKEAGEDVQAKSDAVSVGLMSIGTALMMTGNPIAMAVGGLVGLATTIGKVIWENTGLRKVLTENKEIVDKVAQSSMEARTKIGNLSNAAVNLKELLALTKEGVVTKDQFNTEELAKYYELSNKIAELAPDMVKFYDDQGNAVVDLTTDIQKLRNVQLEQIKGGNETKALNSEGFGEEYLSRIEIAKSKIRENQNGLKAIATGDEGLKSYNNTQNQSSLKTFKKEDVSKLSAEILDQQAELQKINEEMTNNLVNPAFDRSQAYLDMTDKQKEMVRGLFTIEKATQLAYYPKQLKEYTEALNSTLTVLGAEKKLNEDKAALLLEIRNLETDGVTPKEQIKLDELNKENLAYDEQIKKVQTLNEGFQKLGKYKQESVISGMGTLNVSGVKESEDALANLTDYYSKNDPLVKGPMTINQTKQAAGINAPDSLELSKSELATAEKSKSDEFNLSKQRSIIESKLSTIMTTPTLNAEEITKKAEQIKVLSAEQNRLTVELEKQSEIQKESNALSIEAGFQVLEEAKANKELENQYWDQIEALAGTAEGYNQLADAYNTNLSVIEQMNVAIESSAEGQTLSKSQMDAVAVSLENYKDKIPGLSKALEDYKQNGQSSFSELSQYMSTASEEMAQKNGKMYAAMNKDNKEYYQKFLANNKEQTDNMYIQYGIRTKDFETYGDYEQALNLAKENGKLSVNEQGLNKNRLYLEQQVNSAAENMDKDVSNTGESSKKKVSIWALMTNSGLTFADKWSLGWRTVIDGVTGFFAGMGNVIVDIWNGIITTIESGINTVVGGINSVSSAIPGMGDALDEVSLGGRLGYTEGTNLAATKLQEIISAKVDDSGFNYDVGGTERVGHKVIDTPGPISGSGTGTEGSDVNPNAGDSAKAKVQEDMKVDFDTLVLHDTNILLQQQEDLLKRLKDEEDKLYGKAKMDNLTKQNEALARKREILQQQLVILRQHASEMRTSLQSRGAQFNTDGTISNYEAIIKAKVASANAISDPDTKKAAQDAVKQFMDDLKQYEDYQLKVTFDKEQAISEVEKLQRTIYMTQFEYKITVQLELSKDQEEIIKFLKDVNNEFEDMSDTYKETMEDLNGTLGAVAAIQEQLDKTLKDSSLTDKERIELLGKYEKEMEDAVSSAQKLREELVKLNEQALKEGLALLDDQLNKYENIGKELDYITNMLKLTGNQQEFSAIDKIYETQEKSLNGQLVALLKTKDLLKDMLSQQVKGSEEWKATNAQLVKMNEQINKITQETLKTFQEEFNNSFNEIMDKLDKGLSGGMGLDKLKDKWSDLKADGEKYLSTQEKIIWAGNMQYEVQQKLNEATSPETKKKLQEFLDEELNTLTKKGVLTQYEVNRTQKLYDITLAQIALDEARNNKTVQRLVRDSSGNWSYQYMEDTKKVAEAQKNLTDKTQALMEYDKKAFIANQDEMIAARVDFEKKIQDIIKESQNGQYATEEAFQTALAEAKTDFETKITTLQTEGDTIRKGSSESTMAAILATYTVNKGALETLTAEQKTLLEELGTTVGTSWTSIREALKTINTGNAEDYKILFTDIVIGHGEDMSTELETIYASISGAWDATTGKMMMGNFNLSSIVDTTVTEIKKSWDEYQAKISGVTLMVGGDLQALITKTEELGTSTSALKDETEITIEGIQNQWDKVAELINEYQKLDGTQYDAIMKAAIEYIKNLDDIIKKQKEAATGITTPKVDIPTPTKKAPTKTPTTTPPATTPSKPITPPTPSKSSTPSVGDTVSVVPNVWTADSYGGGSTGNPWAWSWGPWRIDQYIPGRANPYHVAATDGVSGTGWVDSVKFDTGGYTGDWGENDGKMAMLHQKEIVLNKEDTSNILSAVQIVRDYASMIKQLIGGVGSFAPSTGGATEQSVTINADFSGVKSSFDIEKAFENMSNRASQFIQKK